MTSLQKTGIIYVRVSSEEQVAGTSLDYQEQECQKYCDQNNIRVIKVFREEGASAKSLERKEFLRAIEYCREKKKRKGIDAFVVHKCDRFARNVEDHYFTRRKLLDYGTKLHSVTEPIDDTPQGKIFEAMLSAFAEFDNSIRRQRSIDGMSSRINEGICPWKPPIGYISQRSSHRGEKKSEPDAPDPDVFPIIQKGLQRFAQGHYDYISHFGNDLDAWGLATARGRETSKQVVHKFLTQYLEFYAGVLHNPFTNKKVRGKHEAMITHDEYNRIRHILLQRRIHPAKKMKFTDKFPLRQLISCAMCKRGYTGSHSKGKYKRYAYYHCGNRKCSEYGKTISTSKMEEGFELLLKDMIPNKSFWKALKRDILNAWNDEQAECLKQKQSHEKSIRNIESQIEKLSDGYLRELFTEKYYLKKKDTLENQLLNQNIQLSESSIENINVSYVLKRAEQYSQSMLYLWRDLVQPTHRAKFMKFVFSGKILYHRLDSRWNSIPSEIFNVYKGYSKNCVGDDQKSPMVNLRIPNWKKVIENLRVLEDAEGICPASLPEKQNVSSS